MSERERERERERLCAKEYEGASTLSITTFRITTLSITINKLRHST